MSPTLQSDTAPGNRKKKKSNVLIELYFFDRHAQTFEFFGCAM